MDKTPLKSCPCCGEQFSSYDLLHRTDIEPLGLAIEPGNPRANAFYFNHSAKHCRSTFVVPAVDLYNCLTELPEADDTIPQVADCLSCASLSDQTDCMPGCYWRPYRRLLGLMFSMREKNPSILKRQVLSSC